MSILFHLADVLRDPVKSKKKIISAWISEVIHQEQKKCGTINIIFCSNDYLLKINEKYLKHHYYTDVITFPYNEGDVLSGDIFISVEQVVINAERFKASFLEELLRVIIHGILHLMGYNDETDNERLNMHVLEDEALEKVLPKIK
jgi:rRNA maturation RNase YbeY